MVTYGEQLFSVRVRLDPDRIAAMGMAFDTVQQAIQQANSNAPVGLLSGARQQLTLRANDQPQNAAQFSQLVQTAAQLGEALGASLPSISRALKVLRKMKSADLRGGRLHVYDWDHLVELGDFNPVYLHLKRPSHL